jgi:RimJ/RimL family protein N-acetyltransferase
VDIDTVFTTERLILRPFTMADLLAVFARAGDPEVMRFHNCGPLCYEDTKAGLAQVSGRGHTALLNADVG